LSATPGNPFPCVVACPDAGQLAAAMPFGPTTTLFNAESGCNFDLDAALDIDDRPVNRPFRPSERRVAGGEQLPADRRLAAARGPDDNPELPGAVIGPHGHRDAALETLA
jgi:hypothetical protein